MLRQIMNDIFIKRIIIGLVLLTIVSRSSEKIIDNICLLFLVMTSISYIWDHFKLSNINRKDSYIKTVLIIREIVLVFAILFVEIGLNKLTVIFLPNYIKVIEQFSIFVRYIIVYRFLFSVMAIVLGLKLSKMLLLILSIFPIVIFVGIFDIKWWAAITGLVGVWNYINSKDFVIFLNKTGSEINIPKELEYKWQRNKFFVTLGTLIFYISLLISSVFEKDEMSFIERSNPRIYSMLGLVTFLAFIYLFFFVYYITLYKSSHETKAEKLLLSIGKKLKLDKMKTIIDFYRNSIK